MSNACSSSVLRARAVSSEVEGEIIPHLVCGDGSTLICERRYDVEALLVRVDIGRVRSCPVEGPVSESVESDFIIPELIIQLPLVKCVLIYETYLEFQSEGGPVSGGGMHILGLILQV